MQLLELQSAPRIYPKLHPNLLVQIQLGLNCTSGQFNSSRVHNEGLVINRFNRGLRARRKETTQQGREYEIVFHKQSLNRTDCLVVVKKQYEYKLMVIC